MGGFRAASVWQGEESAVLEKEKEEKAASEVLEKGSGTHCCKSLGKRV